MRNITFTVNKALAFDEAAKVTAYTGAKNMSEENPSAYDRISITDADRYLLDDYFDEISVQADELLRPYLVRSYLRKPGHNMDLSEDYTADVALPAAFDENNGEAVGTLLLNFFVSMMLAKWFGVTAPDQVQQYADKAASIAEIVKGKMAYKKKPTRTVPTI